MAGKNYGLDIYRKGGGGGGIILAGQGLLGGAE